MAGLNLNLSSFTENTSRLGARISESIAEHTRDLAITRGPGAAYFDVTEDKVRAVRRQLDSNSDREKLDALKTLIALISKGRNVSDFLAHVVKNVASPNLEIRKLVYIFLLRYAESEPDIALLSINTFQKDLTDSNPLIRAMALRVLSGINVPMVANIVILAVKKCATDPSPYVRKAAAFALIKCYRMDPAHLPSLIPILQTLLRDRSPLSAGAVSVAFQTICPTRLDLLHTHYRRLCRTLLDVDPWGQVNVLELLTRYARSMLPKPSVTNNDGVSDREEVDPDLQLLFSYAEPLLMSNNPAVVMTVARVFFYLAPQTQLSKIVNPLLRLLPISKEIERITLANLSIIIDEVPQLFMPHYSRFLIKATDIKKVKLDKLNILLKLLSPENYQALLREFVFYSEDTEIHVASEAIQAIGRCARMVPDSSPQCISILMDFIKNGSASTTSSSVLVLKNLVQARLNSSSATPSSPTSLQSPTHIIADLANRLDDIKNPAARACIVWLVGQYASSKADQNGSDNDTMALLGLSGIAWWAPDVLRRVAKSFPSEESIVKLQVLTLAAKLQVLITTPHATIDLITRYIFSLARYDLSYDVRDRARMLSTLLAGVSRNLHLHLNGNDSVDDEDDDATYQRGGVILRREQVKLVLFEGKSVVQDKPLTKENPGVLGSIELLTEKSAGLESNLRLPDWPEEGTDSSLRDSEEEHPAAPSPSQFSSQQRLSSFSVSTTTPSRSVSAQGHVTPVILTPSGRGSPAPNGNKGVWKNLDEFLDESDEEEDKEEENSEEESEDDSTEDNAESGAEGEKRQTPDTKEEIATQAGEPDESPEQSSDEEGDEDESDSDDSVSNNLWKDKRT